MASLMFERILESVLVRTLGEYVQDINSKDLKLAVWSGKVVLKNLRLKPEALVKADLPIYVHAGLLGSLELSIPWKAMWTQPTIVNIENVVLLAVPKASAPFSAEKELAEQRQKKRNMLRDIAEAQERQAAQRQGKKEGDKQSWAESMITAIIKNIQISIKNVHIRYEDPLKGYSLGITLATLSAKSTTCEWVPSTLPSTTNPTTDSTIYKLAELQNLCMYWNNTDTLLWEMNQAEIEAALLSLIVSSEKEVQHQYLIHPMSGEVRVVIDTRSQIDMNTPKASLSAHLSDLITEVTRAQYQNTLQLIDLLERGTKQAPFAAWHPTVPIVGNARQWWHYLHRYCRETVVKRRIKNWRWSHIKQHRDNCRAYTALYTKKLTDKLVQKEEDEMQGLFDQLDVINITICQQNGKIAAEKLNAQKGWFSSWWGGGMRSEESQYVTKLGITEEEKSMIAAAIQSSEDAATNKTYPKRYVKVKLRLELDKLSLILTDGSTRVAEATVSSIQGELHQIPNGSGIYVSYTVLSADVIAGLDNHIVKPADSHHSTPILSGTIEVNSCDRRADVAIKLEIAAAILTVDMDLVLNVIEFQKTDEEIHFDNLKKNLHYYSAMLKTQGKSGLLYAIEKKKTLDVFLAVTAPRILIPQGGRLSDNGPLIVADLGRITLSSELASAATTKELLQLSLGELSERAYDHYNLNLDNLNIQMFSSREEWESGTEHRHKYYLLWPIALTVRLSNSFLPDDTNIPKIKCSGALNNIQVCVSDLKMKHLYTILESFPKPETFVEATDTQILPVVDDAFIDVDGIAATTSFYKGLEESSPLASLEEVTIDGLEHGSPLSDSSPSSDDFFDAPDHFLAPTEPCTVDSAEYVSQTKVLADFQINNIVLEIVKEGRFDNKLLVKASVRNITVECHQDTFYNRVAASLGAILVHDCCTLEEPLALLSSPPSNTLINISLQLNNTSSPYFATLYNKTEIEVEGKFDQLEALVHIESILNLYEFMMSLLPPDRDEDDEVLEVHGSPDAASLTSVPAASDDENTQLAVQAQLGEITVRMCSSHTSYAELRIGGCSAEVTMNASGTKVVAELLSLDVKQPSGHSNFHTILTGGSGSNLIWLELTLSKHKATPLSPDIAVKAKFGSLYFVFLNHFIQNMLHFLDIFTNARDKMVQASYETARRAQLHHPSIFKEYCKEKARRVSTTLGISRHHDHTLMSTIYEPKHELKHEPKHDHLAVLQQAHLQLTAIHNKALLKQESSSEVLVLLDIDIGSPVIKIPTHSKSSDGIQVELGHLRLTNGFTVGAGTTLDTIDITLHNMCASRIIMGAHGDVLRERVVLQPINTSLTVQRAISPDSYTGPSVEVRASLGPIAAQVGYADYHGVLAALTHNLSETGDRAAVDQTAPSTPTEPQAPSTVSQYEHSSESVTVSLHVTLSHVVCELYINEPPLSVSTSDVSRQSDTALMYADLRNTVVTVQMKANSDLAVTVLLEDLRLEDVRSKEGIQRILGHRQLADEEAEIIETLKSSSQSVRRVLTPAIHTPMLDLSVLLSEGGGLTVASILSDVHLVVNMDFVMALQTFFIPEAQSLESSLPAVEEEEASPRDLDIRILIKNPELVCLSNHAAYTSQALLLRSAVEFKFIQKDDSQVISACAENVMVYLAQYLTRANSIYLLLQPTDVSLQFSKQGSQGEHVALDITKLKLTISPESLNVLQLVAAQFSSKDTVQNIKKEHTAYAYDLWNADPIGRDNRWYIRQAENSRVSEIADRFMSDDTLSVGEFYRDIPKLGQELMVTLDSFAVTFEADYEPLIVIKGLTDCKVEDWGGAMVVEVNLHLEANYYSYTLGEFEPLLEPVEMEGLQQAYKQWHCVMNVAKCPVEVDTDATQLLALMANDDNSDTTSISSVDSMDILNNAPPIYQVFITSTDKLLLTITNSALKNFTVLSEAWQSVSDDIMIAPKQTAHLTVLNLCGVQVEIKGGKAVQSKSLVLAVGEEQSLPPELFNTKGRENRNRRNKSIKRIDNITKAAAINLLIEGYKEIEDVKIVQAGLYLYPLTPNKKRNAGKNLLVEVTVERSSKSITLRSPLDFHNKQRQAVRLWYSSPDHSTTSTSVAVIEAGGRYNVPLDAPILGLDNLHNFHITPDREGYNPSFPLMSTEKLRGGDMFFVASTPELDGKNKELSKHYGSLSMTPLRVRNPHRADLEQAVFHTVVINSPIVIINMLPGNLRAQLQGDVIAEDIAPGERAHFLLLNPDVEPYLALRIINYHNMGLDWTGTLKIDVDKFKEEPGQHVKMEAFMNSREMKVTLGVTAKVTDSVELTVYCNHWMVNCTGKQLLYQGLGDTSEIVDLPSIQQPMMFSFANTHKEKAKLRVKVEEAEWSDYFTIDTVGSSGSIVCIDKDSGTCYEVGVTIALSHITMTNIVTFYPRYQVINELQIPLAVQGANSSSEVFHCPVGKVTPFWSGDCASIVLSVSEGKVTQPIPLNTTQQTVLRASYTTQLSPPPHDSPTYPNVVSPQLTHTESEEFFEFEKPRRRAAVLSLQQETCSFITIVVFVDVRTATTEIKVGMYYKGAAPVRIENLLSEVNIGCRQQASMQTMALVPYTSLLYTWDFPSKKRELLWYVQGDEKTSHKADFLKDASGTFTYTCLFTQSKKKAQWVTFLDGLQRVLLFTDSPEIAECVGKEVLKIEQSNLVVELCLMQPIGISLVDSVPQEVAYIQATSSGAIWERKLRKRDRFKTLPNNISEAFEEAFQRGQSDVKFEGYEADLREEGMRMSLPHSTDIRRTHLPALWLQYTTSNSQNNIHFKINRLQIDNQLTDYTFRHCFYPIPPPAHAVAQQPPKPFLEFCMVKQTTEVEEGTDQSVLDHYKYVKLLIQEFHVKVDAGFLLCFLSFIKVQDDSVSSEEEGRELLMKDLELARTALDDRQDIIGEEGGPPVFFDDFQLSPLKIHISFSPQMFIDKSQVAVAEDTLQMYLRSFGLGLADINDAVLKLALFDAAGQLCTIAQLQDRVVKHYIHQTLTQLYAVVFGLDIIGNPYGLAQSIGAGTKDLFYEPYMGIVQGPGEFAEGVVIGLNSFLRHSVGGVVGAASKISHSLGKVLGKLTFDTEYENKRTRMMAQKPSHLGEGLARGGKAFIMGLYDGVTGIAIKPVQGAAQEGVEGFFKGVGQGLVGAVAKPIGGLSDMITHAIDGIHHHTQLDDQVQFLRYPRYIQPDKVVRPYNAKHSQGKHLLQEVSRAHQWNDEYYAHEVLSTKSVFILTDQRCVLLQMVDALNEWSVEWSHLYQDITTLPVLLGDTKTIAFTANMDPTQGLSKVFNRRRSKTRHIVTESKTDLLTNFVLRIKEALC